MKNYTNFRILDSDQENIPNKIRITKITKTPTFNFKKINPIIKRNSSVNSIFFKKMSKYYKNNH